jgi:hypothetical protein
VALSSSDRLGDSDPRSDLALKPSLGSQILHQTDNAQIPRLALRDHGNRSAQQDHLAVVATEAILDAAGLAGGQSLKRRHDPRQIIGVDTLDHVLG